MNLSNKQWDYLIIFVFVETQNTYFESRSLMQINISKRSATNTAPYTDREKWSEQKRKKMRRSKPTNVSRKYSQTASSPLLLYMASLISFHSVWLFHYINKIKVGLNRREWRKKWHDRSWTNVRASEERVCASEKFALTCKVKVN